jgi:membrane protein
VRVRELGGTARRTLSLLARAFGAWWQDDLLRLGASLAYYTLFAVAPILLIVIAVAGAAFGEEAVRGEVVRQIDGLIGRDGGEAVQALLAGASDKDATAIATVVGLAASMVGASGVFLELQTALNAVWRARPSATGRWRPLVTSRVQAFGVVVAVGFLLLVSLFVSAGLAALAAWVEGRVPSLSVLITGLNWLLSLVVSAALFALLFKVLPDIRLEWNDVAVGSVVTAFLFTIGKHLIGLYLGHSGTASSYGAVGSVVVLLLWVYYSAQILLIGAEFTRLYAEARSPSPAQAAQPATYAG